MVLQCNSNLEWDYTKQKRYSQNHEEVTFENGNTFDYVVLHGGHQSDLFFSFVMTQVMNYSESDEVISNRHVFHTGALIGLIVGCEKSTNNLSFRIMWKCEHMYFLGSYFYLVIGGNVGFTTSQLKSRIILYIITTNIHWLFIVYIKINVYIYMYKTFSLVFQSPSYPSTVCLFVGEKEDHEIWTNHLGDSPRHKWNETLAGLNYIMDGVLLRFSGSTTEQLKKPHYQCLRNSYGTNISFTNIYFY